ncbi:hypothetical protein GRS96_19790 (plasmid) [Rathayibacter sp. VKM Ac-2803]|uniref:Recombinase n=1 Tax=Rathayibacter caricis DSM 15933 TaxID=1328867 RepID=A0A2T4UP83_9MICO|nr:MULTISPECIES: hypothetical protein [Rathayibacter]MWV51510.1 hypothetical protein [Rathayibacter sp. VKM Ac-2803]PTL71333.1 hypothetical protein C1I63_19110 [Rathayibacter caricis DSM 15933]
MTTHRQLATMNDVLEQLPASYRPHWRLFADWCAAVDVPAVPATLTQLGRFFAAVPAAPSTATARVSALRAGHSLLGAPFPVAPTEPARPVRVGAGWVSATDALRALPVTRYPAGLVGRRDGFLLLLLDQLHRTRHSARTVTEADITLTPVLTITGIVIPRADESAACWRCVTTRWLRVLGPAALGFRYTVHEILDPTLHRDDEHDCATALSEDWRAAPTLLPAIDQHGWLAPHQSLSTRAMSAITAHRQQAGQLPTENQLAMRRRPSAAYSLQDLADGYDDVDARLAELVLRMSTLLADNDDFRRS